MAVKSIIDVEVNDESFKTFHALFLKYKEQAKEMPGAWAEVDKTTKSVAGSFEDMVAAMMAQATLAATLEKRRKKALDDSEKQAINWKKVAVATKDTAVNIGKATLSLLKWASITTALGGLLGAGGLYGIDRLASNVSAGRRSSLGVGTSYGEQKAFETDFGRIVDPSSFLAGVSESLHDVTKNWQLRAAGVSSGTIAKGDAGATGAELLSSVKKLVDRTPSNQLQQLSDSRGLGQFFSLSDLVRLRATSTSELDAQQAAFRKDSVSLNIDPSAQRGWQDFSTQLHRAGQKIENVFVKGLTPLTPALEKLSDSFANALGTLIGSIKKEDVEAFGKGIESFAKYIGSDKFQDNIKTFVEDVGFAANKMAEVLRFLGLLPSAPEDTKKLTDGSHTGAGDRFIYNAESFFGRPNPTNPGNIRDPKTGRFKVFNTPEEGIQATAAQLKRYEYADKGGRNGKGWGHLDTIAKIIATYAPASDHNDVAAYIKDVVKQTGFGENQHLELSDKNILAKLTSAILGHENKNNRGRYTSGSVVTILNNTGGSAIVQTAQAAKQ